MSDSLAIRPEPAAGGTLARTPVVHLLLYAMDKALAGTIEFTAPDARSAAVLFEAGRPVKARTSEPVAYLGRSLLELGLLTEDALARSLSELAVAKKSGTALHGRLLLAARAIDASQLDAGLREQLLRKLRYIASFPDETTYAYYARYDALRGWGADGERGFDPLAMIWSLLRDHPPRGVVEPALARISSSPLRLARGGDVSRLGLPSAERAVVELLRDCPMRVDEIVSASGLGDSEGRLLAYLLLVTKQVDVLRAPTPGSSGAPARSESAAPLASPAPVGVPPPPPSAPRPARKPPAPAVPAGAGTSDDGAARRPRLSSVPADLSPALTARRKEILDRAATIDRADYFSMLELARDAKRDEVESAFLELAKVWHPDRLPPELGAVRDACSRVFARMNEARSTLVDDEQRSRYMRLLADGSGSPEMQETVAKVVEAATNFQKAEVCFKRNDYVQAESFCRKAVDADRSQPDYLALLAWLTALKPENQSPDKTREAIQMLDRAVSMGSRCEKAYFWRGMLHKRIGKTDAAVRDFRHAMDLNPRNIDAAREVRLHRMRGGRRSDPPGGSIRPTSDTPKAGEDGKPGLFGRLFKKT